MDYEKEYKGALERARKLYHYDNGETTAEVAIACATIFPELKESEDEKIRKELIEHIKANRETGFLLFQKVSPDDVLAWLKKQGEKTAWSEEDERKLNWVINVWNRLRRGGDAQTTPSQMKMLEDWLKSLKERARKINGDQVMSRWRLLKR